MPIPIPGIQFTNRPILKKGRYYIIYILGSPRTMSVK